MAIPRKNWKMHLTVKAGDIMKLFPNISKVFNFLSKVDKYEIKTTDTDRKVFKAEKDGEKFSAVDYPSGKRVVTHSYYPKNDDNDDF